MDGFVALGCDVIVVLSGKFNIIFPASERIIRLPSCKADWIRFLPKSSTSGWIIWIPWSRKIFKVWFSTRSFLNFLGRSEGEPFSSEKAGCCGVSIFYKNKCLFLDGCKFRKSYLDFLQLNLMLLQTIQDFAVTIPAFVVFVRVFLQKFH